MPRESCFPVSWCWLNQLSLDSEALIHDLNSIHGETRIRTTGRVRQPTGHARSLIRKLLQHFSLPLFRVVILASLSPILLLFHSYSAFSHPTSLSLSRYLADSLSPSPYAPCFSRPSMDLIQPPTRTLAVCDHDSDAAGQAARHADAHGHHHWLWLPRGVSSDDIYKSGKPTARNTKSNVKWQEEAASSIVQRQYRKNREAKFIVKDILNDIIDKSVNKKIVDGEVKTKRGRRTGQVAKK